MLDDCFPEGLLPWIAKDVPDEPEVYIARLISDQHFFGLVTNGVPVSRPLPCTRHARLVFLTEARQLAIYTRVVTWEGGRVVSVE